MVIRGDLRPAGRQPTRSNPHRGRGGRLGVGLHELAGDLAHLSINRFFSSRYAEREYELYSALERYAHGVMSVCNADLQVREGAGGS